MISIQCKTPIKDDVARFELVGYSTDEKPIDTYADRRIADDSRFIEWDTKQEYRYDEKCPHKWVMFGENVYSSTWAKKEAE